MFAGKFIAALAFASIASAAPACKKKTASSTSSAPSATYSSADAAYPASSVFAVSSAAAAVASDNAISAVVAVAAGRSSAVSSAKMSSAAQTFTFTSSAAPAETSKSGGSSSGGSSGRATYFATGLGACGWWNKDSDYIVAMNQAQYSQDTCGKNIVITNPSTGITATAQIVDLCPSCAWGALDMSTSLFSFLNNGNMDAGVFQMEWNYAS